MAKQILIIMVMLINFSLLAMEAPSQRQALQRFSTHIGENDSEESLSWTACKAKLERKEDAEDQKDIVNQLAEEDLLLQSAKTSLRKKRRDIIDAQANFYYYSGWRAAAGAAVSFIAAIAAKFNFIRDEPIGPKSYAFAGTSFLTAAGYYFYKNYKKHQELAKVSNETITDQKAREFLNNLK
jgi:hypothetical protein